MNYPADPGGRFDSDYHRRVLGHLPHPTDNYGWTARALFIRMAGDPTAHFESPDDMVPVLEELRSQGYAEGIQVGDETVWRQTQQGFDTLQMGLPNEPGSDAEAQGPAMLSGLSAASAATMIPSNGNPASEAPNAGS